MCLTSKKLRVTLKKNCGKLPCFGTLKKIEIINNLQKLWTYLTVVDFCGKVWKNINPFDYVD